MNLTITPMNTYTQKRNNVSFEAFKTTPEAAKTISLLKDEFVVNLGDKNSINQYLTYHFRKISGEITEKYKGTFLTATDCDKLYENVMKRYSRPMKELDKIVADSINVAPENIEKIAQDYVTGMADSTTQAYGDIVFDKKTANGLEIMNESFNAIKANAIEALKILGI